MTATSVTAQRLLAAIRPRARRLALWTEHLWQTGQASPDQGPTIGPAEVARLLGPERMAETAFYAANASELSAEAETAAKALAADSGWKALRARFALSDEEADFLGLLLAVELDPGLARVVAYLHDDGRATQPTPWLAARLASREPLPFFGPQLRRWLLASPCEGAGPDRLTTAWQADAAVAQAVALGVWRDPVIADAAELIETAASAVLSCLYPEALAALTRIGDPRESELIGPRGSGRRMLAAQYAAGLGMPLLAVDLPFLAEAGVPPGAVLVRTLREAAMRSALAYFDGADALADGDWIRAHALGVHYLRGVRHPSGARKPVRLAPLTIAARVALWRRATDAPPPPDLIAQRLTPADVLYAASHPHEPPRPRTRRPDHALLSTLPTPYGWDDLVLSDEATTQLRAFESQVRLRWPVYEEWGFARLAHLGQGISALFCGPSGTGKTMAAQVIARSLGLDLLRVDLAGVVNKYVGETEKKLREVFDACEDSGALLFFDEADALFGNRTQVKDAHDRFANIEIDYLLQRVERFDGVAILATNRRQDLDPAFVRRLRFVIEFLPPRQQERLAMWRGALPSHAPSGDEIRGDIDWSLLAERLVMTGAEIKTVAIGAAFLAREEGERIGMRHLLIAAQREAAKQGQRLRIPLREAGE
jgi:AAA+ superfamily predicted ATPase